jgi:putative ABC transport system substrate-binding protein
MDRRRFLLTSLAGALAVPVAARAQQAAKMPRIGFLSAVSASALSARVQAFREGLKELGYVEGKSISIEYGYAGGKIERLGELASQLVGLKVEVIVTGGPTATRAAQEATAAIPIVMGFDDDPVGSGFVVSLARPGRNITGLSSVYPQLSGKQLELLKTILPRLSRVAVFGSSSHPGTTQELRETQAAARVLGPQVQYQEVRGVADLDAVFRAATDARADAVLVLMSPTLVLHGRQIADLAAKNRLPAIYPLMDPVKDGGLLSYGVSHTDLFRRAATYVDKILKGAKPGELPIEQPTKFELVINLKTAKALGLTIPPSLLARADQIIE